MPELSRPLTSQCIKYFQKLTDKGLALERGLLEEGTLKHYQRSNQNSSSYHNDKPKFQSKNKNIVDDDVTDAKRVQTVAAPPRPTTTNHQFNNQNNQNQSQKPHNNFSIQGRPPRSNNRTPRDFTPLAEPIEVVFQMLVQVGVVVFPITHPFDLNQTKPRWYNENEYFQYHHIKGHDT